jgi:hypothetical protein
MTGLSVHATALAGLTRRPTITDGNTVRAHFTHSRFIELTAETDGISAWGVGAIEIAGRPVNICVYLGEGDRQHRSSPHVVSRQGARCRSDRFGLQAAAFHGDGTLPNGQRVYIYAAPHVHDALALARVASFVARNKLTMKDDKAPAKSTKKKAAA